MKELRDILDAYRSVGEYGPAAALATIVKTRGATYRRPGARMLLIEGGHHAGLLCGGAIEKELHERVRTVYRSGTASTLEFRDVTSTRAGDADRAGVTHVLIEPLSGRADELAISLLRETIESREIRAVATVFDTDDAETTPLGSRLVLGSDGRLEHALGDAGLTGAVEAATRRCLETGHSTTAAFEGHGVEVFFELLRPPVALAIFGGGLDSCPLVKLSKEIGWKASIIDPNPAHANKGRFNLADEVYVVGPDDVIDRVPLDPFTVAIVVTHSYDQDLALLEQLIPSPVAYVGVVGPADRARSLLADLEAGSLDATSEQMARVFAPAGIEIGAETPQEVALSVLAQIRAQLAERRVEMLA